MLFLPLTSRHCEEPLRWYCDEATPSNPYHLSAYVRTHENFARSGFPYNVSAPCSPTALGRWKIQFCHADSRPKILVSMVSGPGKRSDASMPVSASGESEARSSMA